MSDQNLKAAEDFASDPDCTETLYDDLDRPHERINVELLADIIETRVAAERTRIRDRMIRKALELRCEAGKYTTVHEFREILLCAATLERFAAELEKETTK